MLTSPFGRNRTMTMKRAPMISIQVSRNAWVSDRLPCTPVTTMRAERRTDQRSTAADRAPDDDG